MAAFAVALVIALAVYLSLDPPADSGRPILARFLHEEFSQGAAGCGCPAARLFCGLSGFLGRGWMSGGCRALRVRTGSGWSGRGCGRPAGRGEQVLPFVLAMPAFGQMAPFTLPRPKNSPICPVGWGSGHGLQLPSLRLVLHNCPAPL